METGGESPAVTLWQYRPGKISSMYSKIFFCSLVKPVSKFKVLLRFDILMHLKSLILSRKFGSLAPNWPGGYFE